MPWDGAELHVAIRRSDGTIYGEYVVAGRPNKESISQPRWAPDGSLLFVWDTSGYWQLYQHDVLAKSTTQVALSGLDKSEFATAEVFLGRLASQTVVATFVHNAEAGIAVIDLPSNTYDALDLPYVSVNFNGIHRISNTQFALIASTGTSPMSLSIHGIDTINHAGSTVYGWAYRNLLKGKWGVIDTADIASCVTFLIREGLVDPKKSKAEYPNIWTGGISLYGVSCLAALETATHKFESRFVEGLLLGPEDPDCDAQTKESVYRSRSPLYHAPQITAPLLLLQGNEDRVVPPSQALEMADAMKIAGGDTKVALLEGEGHGFIKSESLVLEKEEELH
ncbi:Alpha/Beta hydrolase protein [Ilyonectria destructans]|nr:Alpha/Beta hydrolase protein [Ilyonectria destructans]